MPKQDDDKLPNNIEEALHFVEEKFNADSNRPVSKTDLYYLLNHRPFLQIVSTSPNFESLSEEVATIKSRAGWNILKYGKNAMSTSIGEFLFDDGTHNKGKGTLFNQALKTAEEMVEIAKQDGWKSIKIVDGTPYMQRALWIFAKKLNIPLQGFVPSEEDEKILNRVEMTPEEIQVVLHQIAKPAA